MAADNAADNRVRRLRPLYLLRICLAALKHQDASRSRRDAGVPYFQDRRLGLLSESRMATLNALVPSDGPSEDVEAIPVVKRALDLLVTVPALLLFSPVMVVIALAVKLDSTGPAMFRQERVGRNGHTFGCWKFRSMYHDCDEEYHREQARNWFKGTPGQAGYKPRTDPRITRIGRILRATSLDELPQLLNVLVGDMSLVGPRPAIPYERALYKPWYLERERVNPGITGLWQVSGRDNVSAETMMLLDVVYVRRSSPWLDLKILACTVPALFGRPMPSLVAHGPRSSRRSDVLE
jgi:lipopolysaccharide/colanic/teichoic acid biosynthesis glycosyltransferase